MDIFRYPLKWLRRQCWWWWRRYSTERSEDFSHLFYIFHRSVIINNHLFQRERRFFQWRPKPLSLEFYYHYRGILRKLQTPAGSLRILNVASFEWFIWMGNGWWLWLKIEVWMNWMVETFTSNWYLQECGRKSSLTKLKITFRVEWNRWICSKFFQTEKLFCHVFTSHLPTRCLASF